MTQLVDFARLALLCHCSDVPFLPASFVSGRRRIRLHDIIAFELQGDPEELNEVRSASSDELPRILDQIGRAHV